MIIYRQPKERDPNAFPPETDHELGIHHGKIYIRDKGYGRVYVSEYDDIKKVEKIIEEMDPYEFEYYYPRLFVAKYSDNICSTVYMGKFVFDIAKLLKVTKEKGIKCFVVLEEPEYDNMDGL